VIRYGHRAGWLCRLEVALALALAVALSSFPSSSGAYGAVTSLPALLVATWVPDGGVDALVSSGDTIYVGGDFSRWTAPTGTAAVVDNDRVRNEADTARERRARLPLRRLERSLRRHPRLRSSPGRSGQDHRNLPQTPLLGERQRKV
jgi:hypothetical protein